VVNGKIPSNPVGSVQRKTENNTRERFLTAEEETRLRVAIREMFTEHEPEFDLALYTGMRARVVQPQVGKRGPVSRATHHPEIEAQRRNSPVSLMAQRT
jgi:hypothetical protein